MPAILIFVLILLRQLSDPAALRLGTIFMDLDARKSPPPPGEAHLCLLFRNPLLSCLHIFHVTLLV